MTPHSLDAVSAEKNRGNLVSHLGWHFTNGRLRDGRPIPPAGEWLVHDGPTIPCESGLHFSPRLIDALTFAPGSRLHRTESRGDVTPHGDPADKVVARERRVLWTLDESVMGPLLRGFARRCALDVIHLWDAPDVVVRYLHTGDESLRAAAEVAAWAAEGAARAAAKAAEAAARDAAWGAEAADRDSAWSAARAAAWGARAAARGAAWTATWTAAKVAARQRQNRRLTSMVAAARRRTSAVTG